MNLNKSDIIAILIGILFFVVSVVPTLTKRDFDFETDFILIAFAASSSIVITLLIIVLYHILVLRQDFESKRDFPKDKELSELIELFIDSYVTIRDNGDELFKNRLNELIDEFKIAIFDLKNGHIVFEDTERWENFVLNIIRSLKGGDTIKATSLVFIPKWWDSDFGRKYLEENNDAIANKNIKITRLFFLEDINKMKDYAKVIERHNEAGVKVGIINMEDLYPAQIEDFAILGEKYVARLELYKGKVKRAHVYNTEVEIARANELFSDLEMRSNGLGEFKEFYEYLSGKTQKSKAK